MRMHIATPLAPNVQCCAEQRASEGGSCQTRKLRNADPRAHAPTLYIGARGVESVVACVLPAASCTHDVLVGAVANFLPSTVAKFLLLAIAARSS